MKLQVQIAAIALLLLCPWHAAAQARLTGADLTGLSWINPVAW